MGFYALRRPRMLSLVNAMKDKLEGKAEVEQYVQLPAPPPIWAGLLSIIFASLIGELLE